MIFLCLLAFQQHTYYPHWDTLRSAFVQWDNLTHLYSDYPELYRWTWSLSLVGPCPDLIHYGGENEWLVPCDVRQPIPSGYTMPSLMYLHYQHLSYTAPEDKDYPKARLSLSYKHILISAGVTWELTVTSEGLAHSIFWCTYAKKRKTIFIGIIPLEVEVLKPESYWHFSLEENGEWSLEEHDIRDWDLPLQYVMQANSYDVLPAAAGCGTVTYRYTTFPAEILNDLMGSLVGDAVTLQGEKQIVLTPVAGVGDCGQYSYGAFVAKMTHRYPATPSYGQDGPPLEVWSIGADRDIGKETRQVIDGEPTDHDRVRETQEALSGSGLGGSFQPDQNLTQSLEGQREVVQSRYSKSTDLGDEIMILLEMLAASPDNDHLWELFRYHIDHRNYRVDHLRDSTIEFNPLIHCTLPPVDGMAPLLGGHFLGAQTPDPCHFCKFHDLIVTNPYRSWSHARLLDQTILFEAIHGPRGNLYQSAFRFMVANIFGETSITERMTGLADRQLTETHQGQVEGMSLDDLESSRSESTANKARSKVTETLPPLLREGHYDPCLDPSYTLEFLFLFHEIEDIVDSPCGLLWAVE